MTVIPSKETRTVILSAAKDLRLFFDVSAVAFLLLLLLTRSGKSRPSHKANTINGALLYLPLN
jgi:hypothetical protein